MSYAHLIFIKSLFALGITYLQVDTHDVWNAVFMIKTLLSSLATGVSLTLGAYGVDLGLARTQIEAKYGKDVTRDFPPQLGKDGKI
jgi:hypothetical protein